MSRWPTGTSWTACWSKSSPLKITLLRSCKTRCCRSYRYQSSAPFLSTGGGSASGDQHAGSSRLYVRVLCVYVGQAWADAFRSSPDLTGVVHIYEELKRKGVEFPMADLDALSPIHTPQRVSGNTHEHLTALNSLPYLCFMGTFVFQGTPEVDPAVVKYLAPASPARTPSPSPASATQGPQMPSPITATPEQVSSQGSNILPFMLTHVTAKILWMHPR